LVLDKIDKTIIYITDNIIDEYIGNLCRENILKSIGDYPLISVSQKPMNFGKNICVGVMDRNSLSINKQMLIGIEASETKYIAIAEHDCLYSNEHFSFTPPDDGIFWYNENVWLMQLCSETLPEWNGTFSIFPKRKANSQLICEKNIMIKATKDRIDMMADPAWMSKYPTGRIGEAGHMDYDHAMRLSAGNSVAHIRIKLKQYIAEYEGRNWVSKIPNIDIRHKDNFTKNRRGRKRCWILPHWGKMEDIIKNGT
jgi:hypothetical protein